MYSQSYRAALIGHTGQGNFGHGLDQAFWGLPGVETVAVADPDPAGRERAQGRSGAARTYAGYRELLERERPNVVGVCTRWPDQHEAMVTACVEAGVKGIFSEKPIAASLDEADRMLAACDAAGVKVQVAHQNRARPATAHVRGLIQEGKIGRLRAIRAFGKSDRRSGGEDLLVLGTHLMDLMRYFGGNARWCNARVVAGGRDASLSDVARSATEQLGPLLGDEVVASYGFDRGVTGFFESTRAADGGGSDYFRIELCGTGGILAFWSDPGSPLLFLPRPYALPGRDEEWQSLEQPEFPPAQDAPPGANHFFAANRSLATDLLAAIEENRAPVSSGHDARAAVEMIVSAYSSHLSGGRVSLPLAQRTHPLQAGAAPAAAR